MELCTKSRIWSRIHSDGWTTPESSKYDISRTLREEVGNVFLFQSCCLSTNGFVTTSKPSLSKFPHSQPWGLRISPLGTQTKDFTQNNVGGLIVRQETGVLRKKTMSTPQIRCCKNYSIDSKCCLDMLHGANTVSDWPTAAVIRCIHFLFKKHVASISSTIVLSLFQN